MFGVSPFYTHCHSNKNDHCFKQLNEWKLVKNESLFMYTEHHSCWRSCRSLPGIFIRMSTHTPKLTHTHTRAHAHALTHKHSLTQTHWSQPQCYVSWDSPQVCTTWQTAVKTWPDWLRPVYLTLLLKPDDWTAVKIWPDYLTRLLDCCSRAD